MPAAGGGGKLGWLLLAVACQFCWGIYPAGIRYMQTESRRPLTSLQLSLLINLFAMPALLIGTTLPLLLINTFFRGSKQQREAQQACPAPAATANGLPSGASDAGAAAASGSGGVAAPPLWKGDSLKEPLLAPAQHPPAQQQLYPDLEAALPTAAAPATAAAAADAPLLAAEPPQDHQAAPPPAAEQPQAGSGGSSSKGGWKKPALVLLGTTCFLAILFLSQVFSLLFTTAYLSQMVFLLAPVMVAFMAKLLFKSPLPPGLWTAMLFMLIGCTMVIGSKAMAAGRPSNALPDLPAHGAWAPVGRPEVSLWGGTGVEQARLCVAVFGAERGSWLCNLEASGDGGIGVDGVDSGSSSGGGGSSIRSHKKKPAAGGLGWRDAIGIGLSLLGAIALAAFMTLVQRSGGVVSEQQVLWCNFGFQSLLCYALLVAVEPWSLGALKHLGLQELGQVALLAGGVNWGCNLVQQLCIRALGAPQAAAFLPVRLLGSLAASYPLLHEGLVGPWQWGGAGLLMAAVTWYLVQQKKAAARASLAAALAEADAAGN